MSAHPAQQSLGSTSYMMKPCVLRSGIDMVVGWNRPRSSLGPLLVDIYKIAFSFMLKNNKYRFYSRFKGGHV